MSDLLDALRTRPWYRGQVLRYEDVSARSATYGAVEGREDFRRFMDASLALLVESPPDEADGNSSRDPTQLFAHQAEATEALLSDVPVLLAGCAGTGRRTVSLLFGLWSAYHTGHASLLLGSTGAGVRRFKERADQALAGMGLPGALPVRAAEDASMLGQAVDDGAGLIIATPSTLLELLSRNPADAAVRQWLEDLRFVGIDGVSALRPGELAHVSALVRLLRCLSSECRFLCTTLPAHSPGRLAERLLGTTAHVVDARSAPSSAYTFALWFPALDASVAGAPGEYALQRAPFLDDAVKCIQELGRVGRDTNVLLWCGVGPFPRSRQQAIQNSALQGTGRAIRKLTVLATPDDIDPDACRTFDIVVLLGHPGSPRVLHAQIGSLVRNGGLALLVVPDDPLSFAMLQSPELPADVPPLPELVVPRTDDLDRMYIELLVAWSDGRELARSEVQRIVPSEDVVRGLQDERILLSAGEDLFSVGKSPHRKPFSWEQFEHTALELTDDDGVTHRIDEHRVPFAIYDGAVHYISGRPYRVELLAEKRLHAAPDDHPVATVPLLQVTCRAASDAGNRKDVAIPGGGSVGIEYTTVSLAVTQEGYLRFADYADQAPIRVDYAEPRTYERHSRVLKVFCPEPRAFATLLWQYLHLRYRTVDEALVLFPWDDTSVGIIVTHRAFEPLLQDLWGEWDSILPRFLRYAYHVLDTCPCTEGCSRCLRHPLRRQRNTGSKGRAMAEVARLLGHAEFAETWTYKTAGLNDVSGSHRRYMHDLAEVIEALESRFGMTLPEPASLHTRDDLPDDVLGVFQSPSDVSIRAGLPQAQAIQVMAHEFAHQWQHERQTTGDAEQGELPHDGKVLMEGFAQWIAFKICDHLALYDQAASISLRVDDAYGDGFRFLCWVEELAGFGGVMELVQSGSVSKEGEGSKTFGELWRAWERIADK